MLSKIVTIAAKDAKPGDELYSNLNGKEAPCYWWHNVKTVERIENNYVRITTNGWYTVKHAEEGISVRRWEDDDANANP
jgi:hypothetical protein